MEDKIIYDGWLKLYHRQLEGKKYDIIKNYDAVSAIILNEFNEILLVKQFRPSVMTNTLEIPAGCIDIPGEDIKECLVREIKEEANITLTTDALEKIISYKPIMGFSNSTMHIFKANVKKSCLKHTKINNDDVTEVQWMPFNEFEKNVQNTKICDSKSVLAYYYLKSSIEK
ncbi:NUDIX hydrolase [Clostridium aestuarii]|uniref:NUDIX hydrolase n=1 Tax=Clostridium aestuarii TaxID=338193 RepID=A0ABT4D2F9_9CLOT|nr:NUDIX hydrolase [Clostridium aestuarii]MCY6484360.1 NUDIX hydrolase [Clostridium aestuarii]